VASARRSICPAAWACVGALAIAGCGSGGKSSTTGQAAGGVYPIADRQAFLRVCPASASAVGGGQIPATTFVGACSAELDCIQQKISLATFETISKNITLGRSNPKIAVIQSCAAAAVAPLRKKAAQDAAAKELARTAQTTAETLAVDQNGSYSGLSPARLEQLEPTLGTTAGLTLTARSNHPGTGYVVAVTAGSTGDEFSILRHPNGSTDRQCRGTFACATGRW
jgi:hypothetical protein